MNELNLTPTILLMVIVAYFTFLYVIAHFTSKGANNLDFYNASKSSPWFVVAFGMVGASLSGVTFISLPGSIVTNQFSYLQMVMGYGLGYAVIMLVLLPLYYKLNLVSIYSYLDQRFGYFSQKTGSVFFILSRIIGASFRMFLMTMVLHDFIFVYFGVPFWLTLLTSLILIWSYTVKGGIKTIVWTDTLQTLFMIIAVIVAVITITSQLDLTFYGIFKEITNSQYSQTFFFDGGWEDKNNFFKQFLGGAFIAIVMTGLDQDMMQKNLSCKNLKESQKNIRWFFVILVLVNIFFMSLGALLYIYAEKIGITLPVNESGTIMTDKTFPTIALNQMPLYLGVVFLIGLLAAAYSTADSALTSLTTSFCVDILGKLDTPKVQRMLIHLGFTLILFGTILIFRYVLEASVIQNLFRMAGFTYGPLLGLFAFGIFTKRPIRDRLVPYLAIASPILTYFIDLYSEQLLFGYKFGFELLLANGLIMAIGLYAVSKAPKVNV
ncbi:MAG: sodium:solute symporter [Marinicellaceae bacterium]